MLKPEPKFVLHKPALCPDQEVSASMPAPPQSGQDANDACV